MYVYVHVYVYTNKLLCYCYVQVENVKDGSTALVVALGGREWVVVANAGISLLQLLHALLQLLHSLLQLWWWLSVSAGAFLLQLKRVRGVVAKSGISLLQLCCSCCMLCCSLSESEVLWPSQVYLVLNL